MYLPSVRLLFATSSAAQLVFVTLARLDEKCGFNDWVTWLGSIDYVEGKLYFVSLHRYHWQI